MLSSYSKQTPCVQYHDESRLLAPLLALFEDSETSIAPASANERTDYGVFGDLFECVLVGFNGPLRGVQLGPIDLESTSAHA